MGATGVRVPTSPSRSPTCSCGGLLALEDLRIERKPSVSWNDLVAGYELRGFTVAVG